MWLETLDIKQHLRGEPLPDDDPVPPGVVAGLRAELARSRRLDMGGLLLGLDCVSTVGELDDFLSDLYDQADARRVWLGGG